MSQEKADKKKQKKVNPPLHYNKEGDFIVTELMARGAFDTQGAVVTRAFEYFRGNGNSIADLAAPISKAGSSSKFGRVSQDINQEINRIKKELGVDKYVVTTNMLRLFFKKIESNRPRSARAKTEYQLYLLSATWEQKRQLVLKRDNHLCQGCLTNKATEVHHLTYDHKYNEFMFELISICGPCHRRYHNA